MDRIYEVKIEPIYDYGIYYVLAPDVASAAQKALQADNRRSDGNDLVVCGRVTARYVGQCDGPRYRFTEGEFSCR
jgi:hypothetical protein